jgi:protein disulfide-isomerase A1
MYLFTQLALAILATAAMDLTTISHVHDLNNNTFRGFVEDNDIVVIGFVLPWLPSCKRFAREYEEV